MNQASFLGPTKVESAAEGATKKIRPMKTSASFFRMPQKGLGRHLRFRPAFENATPDKNSLLVRHFTRPKLNLDQFAF